MHDGDEVLVGAGESLEGEVVLVRLEKSHELCPGVGSQDSR